MDTAPNTALVETAMAILQTTVQGRLGITVLNKALFYADLAALRDLGETLTGCGYVAIPNGPVVNHYERAVVRELTRRGLAEQLQEGWEKPVLVRRQVTKFECLDLEKLGIAQLVARKIQARSATWVSEYSHENPGWDAAFRAGAGTPIDLNIALLQIIEDDPWIDAAADTTVDAALQAAGDDDGVPF